MWQKTQIDKKIGEIKLTVDFSRENHHKILYNLLKCLFIKYVTVGRCYMSSKFKPAKDPLRDSWLLSLYNVPKTDDVISIIMKLSVNALLLNCWEVIFFFRDNLKCIVQDFFQWKFKTFNLYSQNERENPAILLLFLVHSRHIEIRWNSAWTIDNQYNNLSS